MTCLLSLLNESATLSDSMSSNINNTSAHIQKTIKRSYIRKHSYVHTKRAHRDLRKQRKGREKERERQRKMERNRERKTPRCTTCKTSYQRAYTSGNYVQHIMYIIDLPNRQAKYRKLSPSEPRRNSQGAPNVAPCELEDAPQAYRGSGRL